MNQPLSATPWIRDESADERRDARGALLRLLLAAMLTVAALAVATGLAP